MPVVGHALLGLATAAVVDPSDDSRPREHAPAIDRPHWTLLVVILAYLPDIVAQAGVALGELTASRVSHSMVAGALATLPIAALLRRTGRVPWRTGIPVVLGSILLHDLTDLLQASDRQPLWPLADWSPDAGAWGLPSSLLAETLLFLPVALAAYAWRRTRDAGRAAPRRSAAATRRARISVAATVLIAVAAVATSHVRGERRRAFRQARQLIEQGQYRAAAEAADRADGWPSAIRDARIDYVRAEAALGLGDRTAAEAYYLRAYRADPDYFWTVADLAVLYASAEAPLEQRLRNAAPWIAALRSAFTQHPALPATLARIERALDPR